MTSQFSSQATNENAALQWTGSHNITQGQTQYGYNYHHIDQRTENQSAHLASVDTKPSSQPNTTDVYAEFTTDAAAVQCGSDQVESYYIPGVNAKCSLDDPGSKFKYMAEGQDGDDSNFICTSEVQSSQDQADGQSLCESDRVQYQFEGHPNQLSVNPERGDHAQYVPEEYVHFLLDRLAFIYGPYIFLIYSEFYFILLALCAYELVFQRLRAALLPFTTEVVVRPLEFLFFVQNQQFSHQSLFFFSQSKV